MRYRGGAPGGRNYVASDSVRTLNIERLNLNHGREDIWITAPFPSLRLSPSRSDQEEAYQPSGNAESDPLASGTRNTWQLLGY